MIIIGNGVVVTRDSNNTFIKNGAVAVDGSKIIEVGTVEEIKVNIKMLNLLMLKVI